MTSYQWYVWIPRTSASYPYGRPYNLGGRRAGPPSWLSRLVVWGVMATRRGRLCWARHCDSMLEHRP
jgi:hypothetical protein